MIFAETDSPYVTPGGGNANIPVMDYGGFPVYKNADKEYLYNTPIEIEQHMPNVHNKFYDYEGYRGPGPYHLWFNGANPFSGMVTYQAHGVYPVLKNGGNILKRTKKLIKKFKV